MEPTQKAFKTHKDQILFPGNNEQVLKAQSFISNSQYRFGWECIVHEGLLQVWPKNREEVTVSEMVKLGWDLQKIWSCEG